MEGLHRLIAEYCLHTPITYCPPDPQLNPKPWPPCTHAQLPIPPVQTRAKRDRGPLLSHIPNPKKKGSASYDRYRLYKDGLTRDELLARGLWPEDLSHDTKRNHLTWTHP